MDDPTKTDPTPGEPTEPKEPPVPPTPGEPADPTEPPAPEQKFTQTDIDKAVAAAVKAAKEGWDRERSEAERLAKLSKEEREKEQFRIDREKFDADRAALDREMLVNEAAKQLRAVGVSDNFAELVCGKDAEETKANIDAFTKDWNAAIEEAVNTRLKGKPPKTGGGTPPSASMADIIKSNITQGF